MSVDGRVALMYEMDDILNMPPSPSETAAEQLPLRSINLSFPLIVYSQYGWVIVGFNYLRSQ
jgi:hypothetical protein